MLKDSSDIFIYFSSRRTQIPEISENKEMSYYVMDEIWWNQNKVNIDNTFAYNVAFYEIHDNDNDDHE